MPASDFRIDIFDKDLRWVAPLGTFTSLAATIRWNAISEATIAIPSNHHRIGALAADGARLRLNFRKETLMTGMVRQRSGTGPGISGESVFSCQSDFRLLHNFLGWPAPARPAEQQGLDDAYYTIGSQPAETVLKDAVRRNIVERSQQLTVVVAPDQGRGGPTTVSFRMHPLYDRLFPAVEVAGLGVTVEMIDGKHVVDVVVPQPYPHVLTEASRVIQQWEFSGNPPEATRGIVGAQGQGTDREFIPFGDAEREQVWGDVIEVFRDARDTSETATHALRAAQALEDTAGASSLTVRLAESGNFRIFGPKGLRPGQLTTARVGGGIEVSRVVSEVNVGYDRESGLQLSATIGVKDNPEELAMKAINALARAVTDLRVSI